MRDCRKDRKPPYAERHVRWCERSHGELIPMLLLDRQNSTEGQIYSKVDDLYAYMRDKRGFDAMDEYIREDVLLLRGIDYTVLEKLVGECASRVYNALFASKATKVER